MKSALRRWLILALAAAGAAGAIVDFRAAPSPENVAPPAPPARESKLQLPDDLRRAPLPKKASAQPFAARDWTPARRAVPVVAAPPPPPPRFPFRFAGQLQEQGGALTVLLERGSAIVSLRLGESVEGFRIDALHEDRLEVTHLAGGEHLSVPRVTLAGAPDAVNIPQPPHAAGPMWPTSAGATGPRTD